MTCWVMVWFNTACCWVTLMPICPICCCISTLMGLYGVIDSTKCAWCTASRRSPTWWWRWMYQCHQPRCRRKILDQLDALAMFCGAMRDKVIWVKGRKNIDMPTPCPNCGQKISQKSMSALKSVRHQKHAAPVRKLMVTNMRMSMRPPNLPIMGDKITGKMPMGAATKPAQVAV